MAGNSPCLAMQHVCKGLFSSLSILEMWAEILPPLVWSYLSPLLQAVITLPETCTGHGTLKKLTLMRGLVLFENWSRFNEEAEVEDRIMEIGDIVAELEYPTFICFPV